MTDILVSPEDLQWLRDVYPCTQGKVFQAAIIIGNEDNLDKIVLYETNHYKSRGWVFDRDYDGDYIGVYHPNLYEAGNKRALNEEG